MTEAIGLPARVLIMMTGLSTYIQNSGDPEKVFYMLPLLFILSLFAGILIFVILYFLPSNSTTWKKLSHPSKTKKGKNWGSFLAVVLRKVAIIVKSSPRKKTVNFKAKKGPSNQEINLKNKADDGAALQKTAILQIEIAKLKENLKMQERQLVKISSQKDELLKEKDELAVELKTLATKDSVVVVSTPAPSADPTTPHPTWTGKSEPVERVPTATEAERLLISEQAAEIKRLKDIILQFRRQVENLEKSRTT